MSIETELALLALKNTQLSSAYQLLRGTLICLKDEVSGHHVELVERVLAVTDPKVVLELFNGKDMSHGQEAQRQAVPRVRGEDGQ